MRPFLVLIFLVSALTSAFAQKVLLPYPQTIVDSIENIDEVLSGKAARFRKPACEVLEGSPVRLIKELTCRNQYHDCLVVEYTLLKRGITSCPTKDNKIYTLIARGHWNYFLREGKPVP